MDALDDQQPSASMREQMPIPWVTRRNKRSPSLSENTKVEESNFAVDPSLSDNVLQRTQQQQQGPSQPSPPSVNGGVGSKSVFDNVDNKGGALVLLLRVGTTQ